MRKIFYILFLMLIISACRVDISLAQNHFHQACNSSTVDDLGDPQYASSAKSFLLTLQSTIKQGNKEKFSSLIAYPINAYQGDHKIKVINKREMLRKYTYIMTPEMKKTILSQDSQCLFGRDQGVMIGHGEIWYNMQSDGRMKIIAINPSYPK